MDFNLEKAEKKYNELLANIGENSSVINSKFFDERPIKWKKSY